MAKGFKILVDKKYKWLLDRYTFHVDNHSKLNKEYYYTISNKKRIGLHRLIISIEENDPMFLFRTHEYVDHINGNGLDNRICNLRKASNSLNQINKRIQTLTF